MIDPVNVFENHVGARILDFLDARTPWHRQLWNIGLSLTLREVLEAITAVRASVLSQSALDYLAATAQKQVGVDPGAGGEPDRKALQAALRSKLRPDGLDYYVIAQQQAALAPVYLSRWATVLRRPSPPGPERTSRAIVAHLLDAGFSSDYLHRWWKYRLRHEATVRPLADIVEDAQTLALTQPRTFEVLVPLETAIRIPTGVTVPEWRSSAEASEWLKSNAFDVSGVRQDGGFLFAVDALDPEAAVAQCSEMIDQLVARMAVGSRLILKPLGHVWVKAERAPYAMDRKRRGVWVEALAREHQLYNSRPSGSIDAAIELLSHLQTSSPAAAVAGGWAAIEALLSEPDDRAGAADRLAMLVACSFPRAELTRLSYALEKNDTAFAAQVAAVTENRSRCEIVSAALRTGPLTAAIGLSDRAAAARMQKLLRNPHAVLSDVTDHAAVAFRRMYRQRNLVLHWGKTDAVGLRASLRTAAPLVGAGLDRIIHAYYVDHLSPLQLVARARIALSTVGTAGGTSPTSLLG
jgi:hypothetical protein